MTPALAAATLYTGLSILLGLALTFRVIAVRRALRVGVGDGGDKDLARRIRVHGNFVETAPFAVAILILLALAGVAAWVVHVVGVVFLAGRIAHAIGFSGSAGYSAGRFFGMIATLSVLGLGALALIALSIGRLLG